ncbi:MAG: hypothetical protein V5A18_10670, partial [Haloarculaceae archaeon]
MSGSDGEKPGTTELLARELGRTVEPIATAAEEGPDGVADFLAEAGFDEAVAGDEADKVAAALDSAIAEPAGVLVKTVLADEPSIDDLPAVIEAVAGVFEGLRTLDDIQFQAVEVDELGKLLLDHLLVTYLQNYHRSVHSYLSLLGVIEHSGGPGAGDLDLSIFPVAAKNPAQIPKEVFNWGSEQEEFLAFVVLYYLKEAFWDLGVPASIEGPPSGQVESLTGASMANLAVQSEADLDPQLRVPIISFEDDGTRIVAGFKLVPLPAKNDALPGVAIVPFGRVGSGKEVPLGSFTFNVSGSGEIGNRGFGIQPTTDSSLDTRMVNLDQGSPPAKLHGEAGLEYTGPDDGSTTLLGKPGETRLDLLSAGATAVVDYKGEDVIFKVELPTAGRFVVSPSGGFLEKV